MLRCSFVADDESRRRLTATQAAAIAMEGDTRLYEDDVFYGHQDTLLTWTRPRRPSCGSTSTAQPSRATRTSYLAGSDGWDPVVAGAASRTWLEGRR